MKLIVGLGNPGRRYQATAHNLGFEVAARLSSRWGLDLKTSRRLQAELAEGTAHGEAVAVARPLTYMNLSGAAVAALMRRRPIEQQDLLVVVDDVNLPIGRVRIRPGGGPGGHQGLRSIIEALGCDQFARLRVGIHAGRPVEDLSCYVLSKLPPAERRQLAEMVDVAADAAECWLREGAVAAADTFNGLRRFQEGTAE
jgi:PTH1 family peptidyl-tRNA hydrolase